MYKIQVRQVLAITITFFAYYHQIITKLAIWMLAGGKITRTRKTDLASKLHHELLSDVTSHRVTHEI